MVVNRLRVLLVGALVAAGLLVGAQPASAFTAGHTWAYTNAGYGTLLKTWNWGAEDCNAYPGFVFWSGAYVQQRMSAVNVDVGGRSHCNQLSIRAGVAPNYPYASKCINHNDSGIGSFGYPWNDNVDAVVLQYNAGCPLY